MYVDSVLLESRSLRGELSHRVEILDKVKALALSPDGVHATTPEVAEYFEVDPTVVNNLLGRHREELESNGLRVLRGAELQEYQNLKLRLSPANANSYPQRRAQLAVYTRRTVLNVAMLLRDSPVAQRVRALLLDVEEAHRRPPAAEPGADEGCRPAARESCAYGRRTLERRVGAVESAVSEIGGVLRELGPVVGRMSVRLERMDRRLEWVDRRLDEMDRRMVNTECVVSAMSQRMAAMGEDVRVLRSDVDRFVRWSPPAEGPDGGTDDCRDDRRHRRRRRRGH